MVLARVSKVKVNSHLLCVAAPDQKFFRHLILVIQVQAQLIPAKLELRQVPRRMIKHFPAVCDQFLQSRNSKL